MNLTAVHDAAFALLTAVEGVEQAAVSPPWELEAQCWAERNSANRPGGSVAAIRIVRVDQRDDSGKPHSWTIIADQGRVKEIDADWFEIIKRDWTLACLARNAFPAALAASRRNIEAEYGEYRHHGDIGEADAHAARLLQHCRDLCDMLPTLCDELKGVLDG